MMKRPRKLQFLNTVECVVKKKENATKCKKNVLCGISQTCHFKGLRHQKIRHAAVEDITVI